jgi:hypothetical protein
MPIDEWMNSYSVSSSPIAVDRSTPRALRERAFPEPPPGMRARHRTFSFSPSFISGCGYARASSDALDATLRELGASGDPRQPFISLVRPKPCIVPNCTDTHIQVTIFMD